MASSFFIINVVIKNKNKFNIFADDEGFRTLGVRKNTLIEGKHNEWDSIIIDVLFNKNFIDEEKITNSGCAIGVGCLGFRGGGRYDRY